MCLVLFFCSSCKNLDLRLGFDLCAEEQDFICKRKKVVAAALKNVLQLGEDLQEDEVYGAASWELKVYCPTFNKVDVMYLRDYPHSSSTSSRLKCIDQIATCT